MTTREGHDLIKKPGRTSSLAQVTILALGLLGFVWACSDGGTGPAGDDPIPLAPDDLPPLTGFEQHGRVEFTTHHEEITFLSAVNARSPRVRISVAGTSVQGRPIHLVRVGHPQPPSDEEMATGQTILIVGSQHGNEPAGREASLQMLRNLAFSQDADFLDMLTSATILFIPSANPDGRVANTRRNADNLDLNRDHLSLVSPEARAIAQVLRDFRPDLVIDAHERPTDTAPEMELLWSRNLNVFEPVRSLSQELVEEHLVGDLAAGGWTAAIYPGGTGNETVLSNAVGLRHSLGLLVESAGQAPPSERVRVQLEVFRSAFRFFHDRAGQILAAVTAAPEAKATVGRTRSEPFYLYGADNDPPTSDQILDPPPCSYLLTPEQEAALQPQITFFQLRTKSTAGTDVLLPMDQPLMTVIPLLADGRARKEVIEAVALLSEAECAILR